MDRYTPNDVTGDINFLRDSINRLLGQVGPLTVSEKSAFLFNSVSRWNAGKRQISLEQLQASLSTLNIPCTGLHEVFTALDRERNGIIDIGEFCDAVVGGGIGALRSNKTTSRRNNGIESPSPTSFSRAGNMLIQGSYAPQKPETISPSRISGDSMQQQQQQQHRHFSRKFTPVNQSIRNHRDMTLATRSQEQEIRVQQNKRAAVAAVKGDTMITAGGTTGHEVDFSEMCISKFRECVINRGGCSGIHSLGRIFRIMDSDGDRKITASELKIGLDHYGMHMDRKGIDVLISAIDTDGSKSVSLDEFLIAIRGHVSPRRRKLIMVAFDVLDSTRDGTITIEDIRKSFDVRHHPDVLSGKVTPDQALSAFLRQFDTIKQDGQVSRDEFLEYYKNVSASIDHDDYFELMIRNAWHIRIL